MSAEFDSQVPETGATQSPETLLVLDPLNVPSLDERQVLDDVMDDLSELLTIRGLDIAEADSSEWTMYYETFENAVADHTDVLDHEGHLSAVAMRVVARLLSSYVTTELVLPSSNARFVEAFYNASWEVKDELARFVVGAMSSISLYPSNEEYSLDANKEARQMSLVTRMRPAETVVGYEAGGRTVSRDDLGLPAFEEAGDE